MTENQKKMLFCIEVIRRREKHFLEIHPEKEPVGEQLMKLFFDEIGQPDLFEPLMYGISK